MKRLLFINLIFIALMFFLVGCNYAERGEISDSTAVSDLLISGEAVTEEKIKDDSVSSPEIPEAYNQVIKNFKDMIEVRLSDDFESALNEGRFLSPDPNFGYEWECMLIEAEATIMEDLSLSSFGYVLKDINNDSVPELFFVREAYKGYIYPANTYFVIAAFTLYDGEPQLLGAYWPRNKCFILDSGDFYVVSSGGADYTSFKIQSLDDNAKELRTVKGFGTRGTSYNDEGEPRTLYYEIINGEQIDVTKERFSELFAEYPYEYGKTWNENHVYLFN